MVGVSGGRGAFCGMDLVVGLRFKCDVVIAIYVFLAPLKKP